MLHMKRSAFFLAVLVLFTAGCDFQSVSGPFSTLTIAPPLNPYQSTTKTPAPLTPTIPLHTEQPLIPTPTPFKYIVQAGDTLYGIAIKYNILLDRLVSANPGLDTRLLTVGTEVIIPLAEEDNLPPTPTPYPLLQEKPVCYPTTDGGVWCYALVENNNDIALENVALAFNIYDADQVLVRSQIAFLPLNVLFPGQSIPVGVLIPNTLANQNQINTTLLSAYPSDRTDPLILNSDYSLEYSRENTIVHVSGILEIPEGDPQGDQVWIVGVGFSEGIPSAVRKWISAEGLEQGKPYPFDFLLYSLGPQIDQVQLFSELH
jgi:LysM repeat protein